MFAPVVRDLHASLERGQDFVELARRLRTEIQIGLASNAFKMWARQHRSRHHGNIVHHVLFDGQPFQQRA
jgi:hypothetical protein